MTTTPDQCSLGKRKAEEIAADQSEGEVFDTSEEPPSKKLKADQDEEAVDILEESMPQTIQSNDDGRKRWNVGMEMPKGKPRPTFIGESEKDRRSGSGTIEDPMIIWLGKIPGDAEVKTANEDIARQSAERLEAITNIYIRCAAQDRKFVDRDGKRVRIWNPDNIPFYYRTTAADPHVSLAFGTNADNLVLYGYVHVDVDEAGKPTGLATARNAENIDEEDDRALELFVHDDDQHDCAPYCRTHARYEVPLDACRLTWAKACPLHEADGLLDHWCPRPIWMTEIYGDHYCPCPHNLDGVMDHYCPCPHDRWRMQVPKHCRHKVPKNSVLSHYCPPYPLRGVFIY